MKRNAKRSLRIVLLMLFAPSAATVFTAPGRGFVQPSEAQGKPSLDDQDNWLASVETSGDKAQDLTLKFTPPRPGEYPIYSIQNAKSLDENPGFCGGLPVTGGLSENIVGWINAA